ncbi:hypothetical protein KHA80_01255 [Anaerobacillus sp. HL2]|nr:hypothetical protein KHA80_01255 [Anaerobacillus sp. HL2]
MGKGLSQIVLYYISCFRGRKYEIENRITCYPTVGGSGIIATELGNY